MTTLDEIKHSFEEQANKLGNYKDIPKIDLFNGYCDAEENKDEVLRNQYFAALMLRYWNKIYGWKLKAKSLHLEDSDFVDWLFNCLDATMYYKAWRNEFLSSGEPNEYYWKKDPFAADRSMNFFCSAQYGKEYQKANKQKRKANYANLSIDGQVELNGDLALDYLGCVETTKLDGSKVLIETLLKKDKFIDALIIDGISNADSFKQQKDKVTKEVTEVFNKRKLVKHLTSIDSEFLREHFAKEYNLDTSKCELIYSKLKELNNGKLYRCIDKIILEIKQNPDYLSCLI